MSSNDENIILVILEFRSFIFLLIGSSNLSDFFLIFALELSPLM